MMKRVSGNTVLKGEAASYDRTGLPVGHVKRYGSKAVIQTVIQPGRKVETAMEDVTTEGERQLKELAKKQLNTNVTIHSELARRKHFKPGSSFKSISEEVAGEKSHDTYKHFMDREAMIEELMMCGLSEEEINFKLAHDGFDLSDRVYNKRRRVELRNKLCIESIKEKMRLAKEHLGKADTFSGAKVLSRHEMELETALSRDNEKTKMLGRLLTKTKTRDTTDTNNPINHLDTIYQEALEKTQRIVSNIAQRSMNDNTGHASSDSNYQPSQPLEPMIEAGCAPRPRAVLEIHDADVVRYRLTTEEIKLIPRFKDYSPGVPTNVLYIKNLSPKVHEGDLKALFKQFNKLSGSVDFRLLTGRMKGQAFVTFKNEDIATEALRFANGFALHDKPVIIQYGKSRQK